MVMLSSAAVSVVFTHQIIVVWNYCNNAWFRLAFGTTFRGAAGGGRESGVFHCWCCCKIQRHALDDNRLRLFFRLVAQNGVASVCILHAFWGVAQAFWVFDEVCCFAAAAITGT